MRYVSFVTDLVQIPHLGVHQVSRVVDLTDGWEWMQRTKGWPDLPVPKDLIELIQMGTTGQQQVSRLVNHLGKSRDEFIKHIIFQPDQIKLLAPIIRPNTIRDFYAFEAHVKHANAIREAPVPEEWYQFPVYYYSNPGSVYGPGQQVAKPKFTQELDYELEVAYVIGKSGKNIRKEDAEEYLFGLMIMNDWSARDVQRAEMRVRLGPAKAKDFATSFGPWLVTKDELAPKSMIRGGVFNMEMTAKINDQIMSMGNLADIYYSFGEMLERASDGVTIYPGDIFGSGTVGNGCLLEVTDGKGPWLKSGDVVELEIECLGTLTNMIVDE